MRRSTTYALTYAAGILAGAAISEHLSFRAGAIVAAVVVLACWVRASFTMCSFRPKNSW